jgi:hypothetical protein
MNRFVFLSVLFASPAFPWGCEGHRTAALIALEQLTPHARSFAESLLQGQSSDPTLHRFCGASGLDPFADMSTWADDIRDKRKNTAPWHFIDIPLGSTREHMYEECPASTGCITSVIRGQLDLLRSESAGSNEKVEALMFVIHFIADLHQPLHAADNNDRGGNCVPAAFFGQKPVETHSGENFRPNLHGVWDTDLVERVAKKLDAAKFAHDLRVEFEAELDSWKQQPANLDDWAWESHQLAEQVSYGGLPRKVPIEPPNPVESCAGDNHIAERMYQLHEKIGKRYLSEASPVIRQQLAKAGTRLAMLLNQIWP